MPYLTVKNGECESVIEFFGTPILRDVLAENGFAVISPCGGKGVCGKCAVDVSGDITPPDEREIELNTRLSCRTRLLGDAVVELKSDEYIFDEATNAKAFVNKNGWTGLGVAIDIGTTTVELRLFDSDGVLLSEAQSVNPQRSVSGDVIGRIDAAINGKGKELRDMIVSCIDGLAERVCNDASCQKSDIERAIIAGNTAMLYLLTNRNPEAISHYPFEADELFGAWLDEKTYLTPCMNAYVGGDITCALLASGICESDTTTLLCDIGTNGEMALWKNGSLFVTSAAAGPAFEGAEISCGCQNIRGAVNRVRVDNSKIIGETVGNVKAIGINGTGLIDAVASFLELGFIDNTGYASAPLIINTSNGSIELTQDDIRALQLAKAAIRAGVETLIESTDTKIDEIDELLIAGSFGSNLSIPSAVRIGLIPKELENKTKCIGNASLGGAAEMLFDEAKMKKAENIAKCAKHIQLGGSEEFYNRFIQSIDFE